MYILTLGIRLAALLRHLLTGHLAVPGNQCGSPWSISSDLRAESF